MSIRRIGLALLAFAAAPGPILETIAAEPNPLEPGATVIRVHWMGKEKLGAETKAAGFMRIWREPVSARLEAQTLDKLALAPWRLLRGDAATNGAPTKSMRALLEDLVQSESHLEVRRTAGRNDEIAFCIRLRPDQAGLWATNLQRVVESLTGMRVSPGKQGSGWSLKKHHAPNLIQYMRVGDWMLIGLAQEQNGLLDDFKSRIERDRTLFTPGKTNYWLEGSAELGAVGSLWPRDLNLPRSLPRLTFGVFGDGENVRVQGDLTTQGPLPELEPWFVPTNLIHDPLISFTAVRGVKPWLALIKGWDEYRPEPPPGQLFFWTMGGGPPQCYFAALTKDASSQIKRLSGVLLHKTNPWLETNAIGSFVSTTNGGVRWSGVPFVSPFLEARRNSGVEYLYGGLLPAGSTNRPLPSVLLEAVLSRTNLVYYDWELTSPRLAICLYVSQLFRVVMHKDQLPKQSASADWFARIGPQLTSCVTVVNRESQNRMSFVRRSTVGFTALELQLVADWLESPDFPLGLHTTRSNLEKHLRPRVK